MSEQAKAATSMQHTSEQVLSEPGRSWNLSRSATPERKLEALLHCFREVCASELLWQAPLYRCGFTREELDEVIAAGRQRGLLTEERRGKDWWLTVTAAGREFGR